MSDARADILNRIQAALRGAPDARPALRNYRRQSDLDPAAIQTEFIDKVRDYRAEVQAEILSTDLSAVIAETCRRHAVRRLAIPGDLPQGWLPADIEIFSDSPPLCYDELDRCD